MQLIKILQGALLIASQASAAPVTESEGLTLNAANELVKRANPAAVSCGRESKLSPNMNNSGARY